MSEVFNVFDLSPEEREKFLASLENPHGFDQKEPDAWWGGDVMLVDVSESNPVEDRPKDRPNW